MMEQPNLHCRFPFLAWYRDAELPQPVADLVSAHISECEVCDLSVTGETVVSSLLRRIEVESAPASLQMRIHAKITTIRFE
ncbi:MAG: hypothetical protein LBB58_04795 [Cellulomonadaceae bacterium]|jgi:hypothetical protein|nr:hypothetical protein [Cellulomonadaceae bacterium]